MWLQKHFGYREKVLQVSSVYTYNLKNLWQNNVYYYYNEYGSKCATITMNMVVKVCYYYNEYGSKYVLSTTDFWLGTLVLEQSFHEA